MLQSINFLRRYRDLLVVLLLLALPFVFYVSNSKQTRDHNLFDKAVVLVSAPVQWVVVSCLDTVSDVWHHYVNLIDVQADNDRLKRENARLDAELAEREEQRLENERLRLLVGLQRRQPEVKMVFAQVIATSPTPLFRSVRIDRGRRDGLEIGAAVVSYDGVVGRVAALSEFYADVMLLVDSSSSTDVLVQRTRARARVRGQGGDEDLGVEAQYLPRTADVEPGDMLVTSGLGRTFPRGLRVGQVMSVERRAFGLYQRAVVQPSVDFARLESLMVILKGFAERADFDTPETSETPEVPEANEAWESDLPADLPPAQKAANPRRPHARAPAFHRARAGDSPSRPAAAPRRTCGTGGCAGAHRDERAIGAHCSRCRRSAALAAAVPRNGYSRVAHRRCLAGGPVCARRFECGGRSGRQHIVVHRRSAEQHVFLCPRGFSASCGSSRRRARRVA